MKYIRLLITQNQWMFRRELPPTLKHKKRCFKFGFIPKTTRFFKKLTKINEFDLKHMNYIQKKTIKNY